MFRPGFQDFLAFLPIFRSRSAILNRSDGDCGCETHQLAHEGSREVGGDYRDIHDVWGAAAAREVHHGLGEPWMMGPNATALPRRSVILYPMLPASKLGKTKTLAWPATRD